MNKIKNIKLVLALLSIFFLQSTVSQAQVTIGSANSPNRGSLLDLKETSNTSSNGTKGLMLPRVPLQVIDQLKPMLTDTQAADADASLGHTGLTVWNTTDDNVFCPGVYLWNSELWIPIIPCQAQYQFDCASTTITGTYINGDPLSVNEDKITVKVTVISKGFYSIKAQGGGMTFSASGKFLESDIGNQRSIDLSGSGTPNTSPKTPITIYGDVFPHTGDNGTDQISCTDTITVLYRKMKIAIFGSPPYYPSSSPINASYKIMTTIANFGTDESSKIRTAGISFLTPLNSFPGDLQAYINTNKPDIILITYGSAAVTNTTGPILAAFAQKGVVLHFDEIPASVLQMMNALYGSGTTTTGQKVGSNAIYPFLNPVVAPIKDPILEGPFGNLLTGLARYWKQDQTGTAGVKSLPPGTFVYSQSPYETGGPSSDATLFRHATLGYIFAGDGGFIIDATYGSRTGGTTVDANGVPTYISRSSTQNAAWGGTQNVANGIFFGNAMAWAIDYVQKKSN